VANNLAALGAGKVAVLGAIGEDGFGIELSRALGARGISSDLLVRTRAMQTFTYTKVINCQNGVEDRPRLDFINTQPLAAEVERAILDRLQQAVEAFDVMLISDQAETSQGGVVTPAVRDLLADLAPSYPEKIFFADSRARIQHFRQVIVKPNQQEAESACRELFGRVDYGGLRRHVQAKLAVVTHGGDGVLLVDDGGETWVETRRIEKPVDICGAGDSFSAGMAMALRAGASPAEAARFGHLVASITIMKKGTGTASPDEVLAACAH
jgi:bifunctional ADP-heptose synthase (sugar kinase/adenylyltransferase)